MFAAIQASVFPFFNTLLQSILFSSLSRLVMLNKLNMSILSLGGATLYDEFEEHEINVYV